MRNGLYASVFVAALSVCGLTSGAVVNLEANLDGLQEVPPNASPAFGLVDVTLDNVSGLVTVTSGSYQDLLGNSTAVTLNGFSGPGANSSVQFALTLDSPGANTGTISGSGNIGAGNIASMEAGNTYINLRSNVFPSGEIRGQLFVTPEPASLGLLAIASGGLLRRRRR